MQGERIVLFRPEENAARMAAGSQRMAMAPIPKDLFIHAVKEVVSANAHLVPPHGKGSLYVRPLLMGTGSILGLGPAPSYHFIVYCAPVGTYFKKADAGELSPPSPVLKICLLCFALVCFAIASNFGLLCFDSPSVMDQLDAIRLKVETDFHRAAPGGTGDTKCAGNYSPVLPAQLEAKVREQPPAHTHTHACMHAITWRWTASNFVFVLICTRHIRATGSTT